MHERRNRQGSTYWLWLTWGVLFWFFGVAIASLMLSMSLRGRLKGGIIVNTAVTAYAAAWVACVSISLVAAWKARNLSPDVRLTQLALERRPLDPELRGVWSWARAGLYSLLSVCAFLVLFVALGMAGLLTTK